MARALAGQGQGRRACGREALQPLLVAMPVLPATAVAVRLRALMLSRPVQLLRAPAPAQAQAQLAVSLASGLQLGRAEQAQAQGQVPGLAVVLMAWEGVMMLTLTGEAAAALKTPAALLLALLLATVLVQGLAPVQAPEHLRVCMARGHQGLLVVAAASYPATLAVAHGQDQDQDQGMLMGLEIWDPRPKTQQQLQLRGSGAWLVQALVLVQVLASALAPLRQVNQVLAPALVAAAAQARQNLAAGLAAVAAVLVLRSLRVLSPVVGLCPCEERCRRLRVPLSASLQPARASS